MGEEPRSLEQLLDRFCAAKEQGGKVTLGSIIREVGTRSFAPLLLFAGIIMVSPLSGIPGMPTSMGAVVLLVTVQLLLRRRHFWLPRWVLKRSLRRDKLARAVRSVRPAARFIDRFLRPRWSHFITGPSVYVIGAVCGLIALGVPMMEVVPFSATLAGVALTAFGLSLIARDGALAVLALSVTAGTFALVVFNLL